MEFTFIKDYMGVEVYDLYTSVVELMSGHGYNSAADALIDLESKLETVDPSEVSTMVRQIVYGAFMDICKLHDIGMEWDAVTLSDMYHLMYFLFNFTRVENHYEIEDAINVANSPHEAFIGILETFTPLDGDKMFAIINSVSVDLVKRILEESKPSLLDQLDDDNTVPLRHIPDIDMTSPLVAAAVESMVPMGLGVTHTVNAVSKDEIGHELGLTWLYDLALYSGESEEGAMAYALESADFIYDKPLDRAAGIRALTKTRGKTSEQV